MYMYYFSKLNNEYRVYKSSKDPYNTKLKMPVK